MNKINNRTTKKQILDMGLEVSDCLRDCSKKLKDDKDVVIKFVKLWGLNIQHASDRLRDDEDIVEAAVIKWCGCTPFQYASDRIKRDPEFVKFAVKYRASSFLYACDELRKNEEFILELVRLYGTTPIGYCHHATRDEIYKRLKEPAIQVLEAMIDGKSTKKDSGHLGHFYLDRDKIDLEYFLNKSISGRIAVISNDMLSGSSQMTIIDLPPRFNPKIHEHVSCLGVAAVDMFEFKFKFDEPECVTFRFDGSLDEYLNGVFRCRFVTGRRGTFGCSFGCFDLLWVKHLNTEGK